MGLSLFVFNIKARQDPSNTLREFVPEVEEERGLGVFWVSPSADFTHPKTIQENQK